MNSEKVKEIKEFLEVLSPYGNIVKNGDILTYINKLEKENAKLKKEQFLKVAKFAKLLYTKYKITGESSQVYIFCTEEELNEEVQRCNYDG